jgi:C4-dicarboxylate-specific signal transduction histidine kinase
MRPSQGDWSVALVQYATAQRPANTELFKQWIEQWKPLTYRGMEGVVELFGQAPLPMEPKAVSAKVRAAHRAFLARCGLNAVQADSRVKKLGGDVMATEARMASVDVVGDVAAWGAHFCLFYETKQDLLDTLISYCKSGLEREEYCLWIVAEPLTIEEARAALKNAVPDLDRYFAGSRLEIVPARDWFLQGGAFDGKRLTASWYEKLASLSARGYPGMRITGDTTWLSKKEWTHFCDYEDGLNEVIGNQRLAVLCTYPLAACGAPQILDVVRTHQFVLARRHGNWDVLETATLKRAKAELKGHNEELERRVVERTTELMKASEALREMHEELARVTRLTTVGELTASIAHELKQPLAGAVANSDACLAWLSSQPPNLDEARAAADRAIEAATRASDIIGRIQALFRKAAPERKRVNINEVIEETLGLIRSEALRNNVSLQTELGSQLPLVLGDRVQLQQVVLNLARNGIEAMSSVQDRTLQLRIRSARHDPNQVVVAVADSGAGIDPQVIGRIFEPFYTTKPQGIGMGLAISRSIIEAHGGRLRAEPNTPHGATFQCTLPADIESVQ